MTELAAPLWHRIAGVDAEALLSIRAAIEESSGQPGAAVFALRENGSQTAYLSPSATNALGRVSDARPEPCGPPPDAPGLRLLAGDRSVWAAVVGRL